MGPSTGPACSAPCREEGPGRRAPAMHGHATDATAPEQGLLSAQAHAAAAPPWRAAAGSSRVHWHPAVQHQRQRSQSLAHLLRHRSHLQARGPGSSARRSGARGQRFKAGFPLSGAKRITSAPALLLGRFPMLRLSSGSPAGVGSQARQQEQRQPCRQVAGRRGRAQRPLAALPAAPCQAAEGAAPRVAPVSAGGGAARRASLPGKKK